MNDAELKQKIKDRILATVHANWHNGAGEIIDFDNFLNELLVDVEELIAEQKRLILEAGDQLRIKDATPLNEAIETDEFRECGFNQALTDYQDRIKQL